MMETVAARWKIVVFGMVIAIAVGGVVALMAIQTRPVREAVATYTALFTAANRQDVEGARRLCSKRYLRTHLMRPADEGGIVGLPRNIHKNFQAWRQGANIWVCPTNRVGPVYQFVHEQGAWRFDGPVGLLRGRREFIPLPDLTDEDASTTDDFPTSMAQPD
ncbi:hypothetical protein V5E97_19590 [Singulisphaera sp. Ch08]|uniref:Uncharacterized protein n=1 Tax=Singulisphaera sp. Ch08 TaxID=3120278 RepID=A0AAU7CSN9_9BACT